MSVGSIGGTYGLSGSGMDIDAIVKKLMTGQQAKADALVQKKTVLQWQKTAYNTVYDDINAFRTTAFNFKLQATLSPNKVSTSNTAVVTATANAGAADVNHSVVVAQLASGVNLTSTASISAAKPPVLGTLAAQLGVATTSFNLTIGDGTTSPSPSITINPSTDSINDVVSKINSAGLNVQASYDSTLDRFFLSTTKTGASTGISIKTSGIDATSGTDAGAAFVSKLNIFSKAAPTATTGGTTINADATTTTTFASTPGNDAVFQLDGVTLNEASNTFSVSNVSYNLTGVTSGATFSGTAVAGTLAVEGTGASTNISVTNDVDTAVASMQSFVDSYNKILAEVNGKVKETRYKDYPPLTDAQKAAMKESEITDWDVKAKSGMLHNDNTLTNLVNTMRNAFSSPVSGILGTYNSGASIGITTGDYTEGGKLKLDTNKLRTALNANPQVLNQLFGTTGATILGTTTIDSKTQGIAGRLYDGIKKTMDQLKQTAGTTATAQNDGASNAAKQIVDYNKQISDGVTRFNAIQKAYYTQYNAMEVALSKLSSQSSWLSSQMSTSSN